MAVKYDPCLAYYYTNEPGFVYFSHERSAKVLYLGFLILSIYSFMGIILALFFIYLVKTNITAKKSQLSHSLMMSAIVQLSIVVL
uniref:Uncharacterized protein n=1 Tax=Panagrolaimus sp. ES5 TaxID=591445 RepID=A0AC34GMH6_9BILA